MGILGIHRPRGGRTYDEADKSAVGRFLPHLQRALQLRRRLADREIERQAASEMAERSGTATLAVGLNGDIIHTNRQAEAVLREGDAIRAVSGRLATARRSATERLTMLVRGAAETAAGREGSSGGALSIPRPERLRHASAGGDPVHP